MFESAVLKLTVWYVAVLMLVSLAFSLPIFIISSDRLANSALRQAEILRRNSMYMRDSLVETLNARREEQLELDRQQLLNNILLENLAILLLGSVASYLFARWTLKPIEEAHAAQTTFTANASHQLRTPLATMQAEIDVALRDKTLNAKDAREVLKSNLEEIGRLRALSDQLLGLTRSEEGELSGVFDASKLVVVFVSKYAKQYQLTLKQTDLPKAVVNGDEVLISEVLKVLCENAAIYSQGKVVVLNYALSRGAVRISVTDKGPGLGPEEQRHVFDRFYRARAATKLNPAGHGLGLALAREIVDRHGGNLSMKSKVGYGSTFTVVLPCASKREVIH